MLAEIEELQLRIQDGRFDEIRKWYKQQIDMLKVAQAKQLDELAASFKLDAKKWAEEKLSLCKRYETMIRESQFSSEEYKKKYERIMMQEIEKKQEVWQHAYEELRIEINLLRELLVRKDKEIQDLNVELLQHVECGQLKITITNLRATITKLEIEIKKL